MPYNRGAHSNFWSFVKNTPKGVSIHEIDKGVDTGNIIIRKKIRFNIDKKTTFKTTYKKLILEIENLFKKNYQCIINNKYKSTKQKNRLKLNLKKDLPKSINWETSIKDFILSRKT